MAQPAHTHDSVTIRSVSKAEVVARRWLRIDSFYCAAAGGLALSLCVPLARLFKIPFEAVVGVGAVTIFWAWLLMRLARRRDWRQPLRWVAAANAAASAGVAILAALAPEVAPRLLLTAVAVEVAVLAAVQVRILRRAPRQRIAPF